MSVWLCQSILRLGFPAPLPGSGSFRRNRGADAGVVEFRVAVAPAVIPRDGPGLQGDGCEADPGARYPAQPCEPADEELSRLLMVRYCAEIVMKGERERTYVQQQLTE